MAPPLQDSADDSLEQALAELMDEHAMEFSEPWSVSESGTLWGANLAQKARNTGDTRGWR